MLGRIALLAVMLALGAFVAESLVEGTVDLVDGAHAVRGCEDWELVCACEHPLDPNKPWPVQC